MYSRKPQGLTFVHRNSFQSMGSSSAEKCFDMCQQKICPHKFDQFETYLPIAQFLCEKNINEMYLNIL